MSRMDVRLLVVLIASVASGCGTSTSSTQSSTGVTARNDTACTRAEEFGPVLVVRERFEARNGAAAATFSSLSTSEARPLEECGVEATLRKLVSLRCNDGSNPFDQDLRMAHASRRGSVGPGGQCGSMIDVYEIVCPERKYEVFADSYVCPQQ